MGPHVTFDTTNLPMGYLLYILFFLQQVEDAERSYIESDMQQNDDEDGTRKFWNIESLTVHRFMNQRETFLMLLLFNRYDRATSWGKVHWGVETVFWLQEV